MKKHLSYLSEESVNRDPFIQFADWFKEHSENYSGEKDAVVLATAGAGGKVSARMVLLKEFDYEGFVFYSNYDSKKGKQLAENNNAALLFYWPELHRQVRIEGTVEKVSPETSDAYFYSRPAGSRASAVVSPQSSIIPDRQFLRNRVDQVKMLNPEKEIKRPANWGGYRLRPVWFDFWLEGDYRLHDRIAYEPTDSGWKIFRLAP